MPVQNRRRAVTNFANGRDWYLAPDVWSEAVTPPSFLMSSDDDPGMMEPPIQNTGFVSRSAADCVVKVPDEDEESSAAGESTGPGAAGV